MCHLDDLLFIDEFSHKGFCSEECIEDFYFPLIKHFEIVEHSMRSKLNMREEQIPAEATDEGLVEEVVTSPTEIYRHSNELQETFYHFIKQFPDFVVIVIASVYRKEASFIFLSTVTKSKQLVNEFRYGEKVNDWEIGKQSLKQEIEESLSHNDFEGEGPVEQDFEDEDMIFMQLLESKKSKILADVIINRREDDISFEEYPGYEFCFQETLELPDEVFEKKDDEGDKLFTYIKSFSKGAHGEESFFYIVICLRKNTDAMTVNVYPILAIPTTDIKMCQEFRGGTRLSGPIKN
ncbi:MAG: hypothetical protein H7336_12475 [Bacteriovorax sp.]|nr:hypothetical protein [Bacteriovorax sp.]